MKQNKKIIAIDFDGVIHSFPEFIKGNPTGLPIKDSMKILKELEKEYELVIFTARKNLKAVEKWMKNFYKLAKLKQIPKITNKKIPASYYIDDNAIRFIDWEKTSKLIKKYDQHRN